MSRTSRSASATPTSQQYAVPWTSFFPSSKPSTGSRDSGCYDSSECMSRDNVDGCRNRTVHDKENLRPYSAKKPGYAPLPIVPNLDPVLNGAKVSNVGKSEVLHIEEKIYSEEDQEVCHITACHGYKANRTSPRQQGLVNGHESASSSSSDVHSNYRCLNIPILGSDWKVFSDCCSQTSPYGPLDESFDGDTGVDIVGSLQGMSSSVHGDLFAPPDSTFKKKSKPYARKIAASVPLKDAQVQVMCPLGVPQLQSPSSPNPVSRSVAQSNKNVIVNQSNSDNLLTQYILNKPQGDNINQSGQNWQQGKSDPSVSARISYTSQNSRDGDSGSDASTVKSESEQGRSTPDSLFGPIHANFKSIKRSVIPKVTSKLAMENIDLAAEPYSSPVSMALFCEKLV